MPADALDGLRSEIIACRACPRLVACRERFAHEKKREFRDDAYWGRAVPGFGDPRARLVVVGLAPSAHGANRTGRLFTGDRSAAFLVDALHAAGFASQPTSLRRNDGLRYTDLYLTAAVRCVPPDNRPRPDEQARCRPFLAQELKLLGNARAVLALGGFAFEATLDAASSAYDLARPRVAFGHGVCVPLGAGRPNVWGSYHPSPQNTNNGRLSRTMLLELLRLVRASYAPSPTEGKLAA